MTGLKDVQFKFKGGFYVEFPMSATNTGSVFYKSLEIHQKIREHDTAVISLVTRKLDWLSTLGPGTPVMVSYWGRDKVKNFFVGYVTHIRPVGKSNETYTREIICVAASRVLRTTARKTYRNKTAPEIVQTIGKKVGFKVVTKNHPLRRPTVVQSGETYWEFLAKLAKRTGYVLRVDQTTIFFLPLKDMVKMYKSRSPYITDYGVARDQGYSSPNIIDIDAWAGDTSDDPDNLTDSAVFTSVNPATGEVRTATARPGSALNKSTGSKSGYDKYPTGYAVHSRRDAKILAKGAADAGMMALDMQLTVGGSSDMQPYRPVILSMRDKTLNDYWIIKEATHRISKSVYHVDLVISTDSIDGPNPVPSDAAMKYRDLKTELEQGIAPDVVVKSRLKPVGVGFIVGSPGRGGKTGRWVAR